MTGVYKLSEQTFWSRLICRALAGSLQEDGASRSHSALSVSDLQCNHSRIRETSLVNILIYSSFSMSDPVSAASAVVGLVVPALHGAKLLLDDLQKIIDAPKAVAALKGDIASVLSNLELLQAITEPQWAALGSQTANQVKATISACSKACDTLHSQLKEWIKHSRDGKLSWRDRFKVGFLKEERLKDTVEQLQSTKLTLNSIVGTATLYVSHSAASSMRTL